MSAYKKVKVMDLKMQDLLEVVSRYEYYVIKSDLNTGVHYGCDCGCGGDAYTQEGWDEMIRDYKEAIADMKELCQKLDIVYCGHECALN